MASQDGDREIARVPESPESVSPVPQGQVVRKLRLGQQDELDLTNLDPLQQNELETMAHEKAIERADRRQQMKDDLAVFAAKLAISTKAVGDATALDAAATIHERTD